MYSVQIRNVLLSKDQSGLPRTLTEHLKDKKDVDRVPWSVYKQYKLAVPVVP